MTEPQILPSDEGRHAAGPEPLWGESWYLDFAADDGSYGGYVRLGLYPNLDRSWLWIHLVGQDQPLVLVREHDLSCPPGDDALHPRGDGVTAALEAVEPLRSYRVRGSATGVRIDDPAQTFHGEQGPAAAVRVDLTWETRSPVFPYAMTTRYEISCDVHGEIVIDGRRIEVDCGGQRDHSWGVRDWWQFPWNWTSGRLDDGTRFHAARSIIPGLELFATGYTVDPSGELHEVDGVDNAVVVDDESLPVSAEQRIGPLTFRTTPVGHAPVLLVSPDGAEARFPRAMCRYELEDGRVGMGWTEYNWPPGWPQRADA